MQPNRDPFMLSMEEKISYDLNAEESTALAQGL